MKPRAALVSILLAAAPWLSPAPGRGETRVPSGSPFDSVAVAQINRLLNGERWAEAESLITEARGRLDAAPPVDSLEWARGADLLVAARVGAGRSGEPEVRSLAERALALRERLLGPDDLDVARSLIRLAQLLNTAGDCRTALPHARRGVAIRVKNYGEHHVMVARGATIEGMILTNCGDYAAAREAFQRTLAIREAVLGPEHPEVVVSLTNLASVDRNLGDFRRARGALERAMAILGSGGAESSRLAFVIQNLADCDFELGEYARSAEECGRALEMRVRLLGPDHREVASSWNNLGSIRLARGDYAGAREAFERAIAGYTAARGAGHPDVALATGSLGGLRYRLGDYAGARDLYRRALDVLRAALGEESPSLATATMDLAGAEAMLGERESALALARRAVTLADAGYGAGSPLAASARDTYGSVCEELGLHEEALASYERVLAIRESLYGPDHPEVARALELLAEVEAKLGRPERAWPRYARAIAIREAAQGPHHPSLAAALAGAARLRLAAGARAEARELGLRAERIAGEHVRLTAQALPEREALRYAATRPGARDLLVAMAARGEAPEDTRRIWEAALASRAQVLEEMAARLRTLRLRDDPDTRGILDEFGEASAHLARLLSDGATGADPRRARERIEEAEGRRERAERALAEASAPFRRELERQAGTLEAIEAALPDSAVLVAFTRYADGERGDAYAAFVLRAGDPAAAAMDLGAADRLDEAIARWRAELDAGGRGGGSPSAADELRCRSSGEAVRRLAWDPLGPLLRGAGRVFVVPDGPLHLVNLAALPAGDGGYLVESGPLLHVLAAERDLLPPGDSPRPASGLLAMGGVSFDAPGLLAARPGGEAAEGLPVEIALAGPARGAFRGPAAGCAAFQAVRFAPLEDSAREAERVVELWRGSPLRGAERAEAIAGAAASEETFKALAPGHRVLHLATHGFFVGARCEAAAAGVRGIGGLAPAAGVNLLRLSGVALAGANLRADSPPEREDGILTAEEIAALDLEGVEWAVLSACDTGVGEIERGEGVFGLRRALRIAGARTLILSLWGVRDADALAWMEALYTARLSASHDTARCVSEAGRELLARRRAAGESTHPFHWAGFVASGDWR